MVKLSGTGIKFYQVRKVYIAKMTRGVPKISDTRAKILAVSCPKCQQCKRDLNVSERKNKNFRETMRASTPLQIILGIECIAHLTNIAKQSGMV